MLPHLHRLNILQDHDRPLIEGTRQLVHVSDEVPEGHAVAELLYSCIGQLIFLLISVVVTIFNHLLTQCVNVDLLFVMVVQLLRSRLSFLIIIKHLTTARQVL